MKKIKKLAAAFTAAAMLLLAACAGENSESSSIPSSEVPAVSSDEPHEQTPSTTSNVSQTASPAEETPAEVPAEIPPDQPNEAQFSADHSVSNTWESEGMKFAQFDFSVINCSSENVSGWTAEITFGSDISLDQIWNAEAETSGNSMTVRNAGYNAELSAGAKAEFGLIVKSASAPEVKSVTVNGSAVQAPADTPTTTAAQTTAAPVEVTPPDVTAEVTGRYGLVSECGQLSVKGADLVDSNGNPVQLRGVSTHGIQWFPQFANKSAFKTLRDDWNANVIRLAMYTGESEGYTSSTKDNIEKTVLDAVDACIELDMYVIIDWHVLADQSPQVRKSEALRFFEYVSKRYADYPNVIYEICNEPNGYASWEGEVKPYAEEVIPVIRNNDPDSVIIVGTPTWSQDIDKALSNPLKYDNVMYALHYYAATHTDWLRDRVRNCYNSGLPIFVSEFGNCDASGNGNNDLYQAKEWLTLLDSLNISYCNWSLCDKQESASILRSGASAQGGWSDSDLTESGLFYKNWLKEHG